MQWPASCAVMVLLSFLPFLATAQNPAQSTESRFLAPAETYAPARARLVAGSVAMVYAGSMTALYSTWYSDYPLGRFHVFNDSDEWLQMDKAGHTGSAYYLSRWSTQMVHWAGVEERKSVWWGMGISYAFLSTIEILDGFAVPWGFSLSDMAANTAGVGLFGAQAMLWQEQRISFKFSYVPTNLAELRPSALGESAQERLLKDYNGQTYWLSANIRSLAGWKSCPAWLNIAVGYGAQNMLSATGEKQVGGLSVTPPRYRQWYLSPDIDLTKIKTDKRWLKTVFEVFGFLKVPAPAIEFRKGRSPLVHGFYF